MSVFHADKSAEGFVTTDKAMIRYHEAYLSLFRRPPSELRDIGNNWVLVNGARMSIDELEVLTSQLQRELQQERARKRNLVQRLLNWFSN